MLRVRVFQCPSCREFIAADASSCRFCSIQIDTQEAYAAAERQHSDNTNYRRRKYVRHILTGAGLYVTAHLINFGLAIAGISAEQSEYAFAVYGLLLTGVAYFIYGLVGYFRES